MGETDDAQIALNELQSRYPGLPAMAAGFSFGSRIALKLSARQAALKRVIAVGFPTRVQQRDFVYHLQIPKYFIQSTIDEFGPRPEMEEFFASVPEPKEIRWVEASNHFFAGALDVYEGVVEELGMRRGGL
jgi:hypothetical protein